MSKTKQELLNDTLHEAKQFAKDIRQYLYSISKQRALTKQEQQFYDLTHDIHVHTNDALVMLNEDEEEW